MKTSKLEFFPKLDLELIVNQSLDTLFKFDIADFFCEEVFFSQIVLNNGIFQDRIKSTQTGYSIRGNKNSEDIIFTQNNLDHSNISQDFKELLTYQDKNYVKEGVSELIYHKNSLNLYSSKMKIPSNKEIEELLLEIYNNLMEKCSMIKHLKIVFIIRIQKVLIINNLGFIQEDFRPFMKIVFNTLANKNGKENSFFNSIVSRISLDDLKKKIPLSLQNFIIKMEKMIEATNSISGKLPIVFASGDGVLIHEAIGHPLEADFHRKETSAFFGKKNQLIASKKVNIIDDGTILGATGSINFDDEGIQSQKNVLVKKGELINFITDRKNAKLLNIPVSGNGRKQDRSTSTIPRMTNTYIEASNSKNTMSLDNMLKKYSKCVYVCGMSHGAVDISSGQFSFTADEAYLVQNGIIIEPLKECVFSGLGSEVLKNIDEIGSSMTHKPGTCGKNGSWVPVTCGQTDLLVKDMNLG